MPINIIDTLKIVYIYYCQRSSSEPSLIYPLSCDPDDIGFEMDNLVENLKKAPWVAEIAGKPANSRTTEDIDRVVNSFICEYWLTRPEEVTTKDVADVLKVADPLSKRHLIGQKVAIDCIYALNQEQLRRLDAVLNDIEKNPDLGKSKGIGR